MKAFRSLDTLREPKRFQAWLMGIARNTATTFTRSKYRRDQVQRQASEELTMDRPSERPSPERAEVDGILWREVQTLEEVSRETLMLYYYAGQKTPEIAQTLGISRDAVRKRLQRAREQLGTRLLDSLELNSDDAPKAKARAARIMTTLLAGSVPWLNAAQAAASTASLRTTASAALFLKISLGLVVAGSLLAVAVTQARHGDEEPAQVADLVSSSAPPAPTSQAPIPETNPIAPAVVTAAQLTGVEPPPELPRGSGTIYGHVFDLLGKPAADVTVTALHHARSGSAIPLIDGTRTTTANVEGRFTLRNLPANSEHSDGYFVVASADWGVAVGFARISTKENGYSEDAARLRMQMRPRGFITGTVHDANAKPVVGAKVYPRLDSWMLKMRLGNTRGLGDTASMYAVTDTEGRFIIDTLWGGPWTLIVGADGFGLNSLCLFWDTFHAACRSVDTDMPGNGCT